jgi:hypothetical protein
MTRQYGGQRVGHRGRASGPGCGAYAVCHTDGVAAVTVASRRIPSRSGPVLVVLAVVVTGALAVLHPVGSVGSAAAANAPTSSTASAPLRAPRTTDAQDTRFFTDVAEADGALASYQQKRGNVALRALLTDGTAFCALLTRAGGLDAALVEEATGARSTESQTHLPLSVTTFNTIESVALLALCPSEQKLVPASVRSKIRSLGKTLGKHPG